ncbi:MAG: hypothetical protein WC426_02635 [Sulfuriferula sp.]
MANRYSVASGLASAPSTWDGGVSVPVEGDRVLIQAAHTVTLDGTFTWGDDLATTIVVNGVSTNASIYVAGVLKASRTVSNSLTCKGDLRVNATGTLDYGRSAIGSGVNDQIPLGVNAVMYLNKSATPASAKYGLMTDNLAKVFHAGATRDPRARLTVAANAGDTSITVDNVSGWQVGDTVCISSTDPTNISGVDIRTIGNTISGASGAWIVPLSSALTYGHNLGAPLGTFSSNVAIYNYSDTYPSFVNHTWTSASQGNNTREFSYSLAKNLGDKTQGSTYKWGFSISPTVFTSSNVPMLVNNSMFYGYDTNSCIPLNIFSVASRMFVNNCAVVGRFGASAVNEYSGAIVDFNGMYILCGSTAYTTGYSQGGMACNHNNCIISGVGALIQGSGITPAFTDCELVAATRISANVAIPSAKLIRLKVGALQLPTQNNVQGAMGSFTYDSPLFVSAPPVPFCDYTNAGYRMQDSASANFVQIKDKNGDPTQQELYTPYAQYFRDNVTKLNGSSSLRVDIPTGTLGAGVFAVKVPAPNGVPITLAGNLRFNSAYGSTNLPSVTISGLGITPQTFACANTPDVWQPGIFSVTQNSGYDGQLDLIFTTNSQGAGASAWFDGTPDGLFITWTRIYGYKFNESAVTKTIDAIIAQPDASIVSAYTGISIDTIAQTLTLTADHSMREIYDYVHWYGCQPATITMPEFLTSTDGFNFACTYDLVLSNAQLTGAGAINMPANTLTLTGIGGSTLTITHSAGVLTAVKLTELVAGSRVQLWDVAGNVELYNDVPGATLTYPMTWTADKSVRIRAMYADASTAKIFYESTATLYNTGLNLAINQITDPVYATNGINGALVTGIIISDTLMLLEISTGALTWAQIYAYETYWLTTAAGITDFARIIDAIDTANYILTSFKIKNISSPSVPLVITGGYGRDSLTGQAVTLIDNTGGTIFCSPDNVIAVKAGISTADIRTELTPELALIDKLTFTLPNKLDTNIAAVGGKVIGGSGTTIDPWKPV